MKGLIISQYFWPENFKINELALELNKKFEIDVLTSYPNYPKGKIFKQFAENKKKYSNYWGINIYRIPQIVRGSGNRLRIILNYISFTFNLLIKVLFIKKKYDFIFIFAPSPIFVALAGIFLSKKQKSKLYIWVLDMWPEILKELKLINSKLLIQLIDYLVVYIYNNCDKIFVQSNSFKNIILKKLKKKNITKRVITIYSWSDNLRINKKINKNKKNDKTFRFLFTGNIGHSQNLFFLLDTIKKIYKKNLTKFKFIIIGSGRKKKQLESYLLKNNLKRFVDLKGFMNFKNLEKIIYTSDVLYLSLVSGKYINSTIPAKFQTYLNYKKPILASIDGEVKTMIKKYNCGLVSSPNDEKSLTKNIIKFLNMKKNFLSIYSKNSLILSKKKFDKKKIINKLINEIDN